MIFMLNLLLMAQPEGDGGMMETIIGFAPFILIIVVVYMFMIRPQQKKMKDQKSFREVLGKGDKVVTIGGVHGKIIDSKDNTFIIEIGNNMRITIEKAAVSMESTSAAYPKSKE